MLKQIAPGYAVAGLLRRWALCLAIFLPMTGMAHGDRVHIAVAANFTQAAEEIGAAFEQATGHEVLISYGSTGQLYAQIAQGAPFDVFLAADQARPKKAVEAGLAVPGSRLTYATGRIVLFSRQADLVKGPDSLRKARFSRLAIANPVTAPYGAAAIEAMKRLGVHDAVSEKLVRGNNIAQTYQFVETGNAEIGFVALAQVAGHDRGSRWIVPEKLHKAIAQDAVLLRKGENNAAASAFMKFLQGEQAKAIKETYGYGSGNGPAS